MNYYSEKDIRDIVAGVLRESRSGTENAGELEVPVEVSARHVHLTREALETLFGKGYELVKKKDLSQPGEFLSCERVRIVTRKGTLDQVAVLGPVRSAVQVELSATDARSLGIRAPVRLSGDLRDAADVLLLGPEGMVEAKGSAIVAQAHVHMTPEDARRYRVQDGQTVRVHLHSGRPVTLEGVAVRVKESFRLALHIDFDEANAGAVDSDTKGYLIGSR